MMKIAALLLALALWTVPLGAQDPLTTIPEAYKVQFENDWVRVVRVRVAVGAAETHNAENPASTPSDFLRVQFKTDAKGERNLRRRIPANGAAAATEVVVREEYANAQMRISRVFIPPGQFTNARATATQPALVISLPGGQERWIAAGQHERLANSETAPLEFVRIDFLTDPTSAR